MTSANPLAPSAPPAPPAREAADGAGAPGVRGRPAPSHPYAWLTALGLFLGARLTGTAVLTAAAAAVGKEPFALLGRSWDSVWYLGIAADGYGRTVHYSSLQASDLAFFPLYPALVRAVTEVAPLGGGAAGLLVSWAAAAVAACGMYAVGARLHGPAAGTALVLLWGLLPHSVVLSMAYTEPLLTACAAWALYAVLTGRWVRAGALAALAGLSRPNGVAVAAAVVVAAVYELARGRGRALSSPRLGTARLWTARLGTARLRTARLGTGRLGAARLGTARLGTARLGTARQGRARLWTARLCTAVVLAPLGWCGHVLWVGVREGDPLGGYFAVQRRWSSRFDFGQGALRFVRHLLLGHDRFVFAMTTVIAAVALLLFALLLLDRPPLPLLVYTAVLLVIALGGDGFFASKPRFLLPAFPLLLPLALALARTARARPWHATVVVAALAGLSYVYGAYLVVVNRVPL
ncbi:hypothetical protein [Streptomyces neyagawaensis]|uniref:Integral membrane protein n=1 Tax=Streptomyces neyagawaensis TaxID=42238 RepID=A0ABV3B0H3_9ACTN